TIRGSGQEGLLPEFFYQGQGAFFGGPGNDTLFGTGGELSVLDGEDGHDRLVAGVKVSVMRGGSGNDTLEGLSVGGDNASILDDSLGIMIGGPDTEIRAVGEVLRGNYTLIGGDLVNAGESVGDPGIDFLFGGFGDDTLIAGNAFLHPDEPIT